METEHARCAAHAPAGPVELARTREPVTTQAVRIWERLSIPASSSSNRDLTRAVLLHSLALTSTSTYTQPCHWEALIQRCLRCRSQQPKGTGLARSISAKKWDLTFQISGDKEWCWWDEPSLHAGRQDRWIIPPHSWSTAALHVLVRALEPPHVPSCSFTPYRNRLCLYCKCH